MRRSKAPSHLLIVLIATIALAAGCAKRSAPNNDATAEPAATQTPPPAEQAFELRDDTANLLLTWVDDKGDFLVGEKLSDVPEASKDQVRVVITTREEGTGQTVFVANLRTKNADGTYPLKTLTRAEWNEVGASRRKVRMEALAPTVASTSSDETSMPDNSGTASAVKAVVYGASWCKPCHDAEALLKKLGVDVTKKDIEQSQAAQAEMQQKLTKAGRGGASIPVIDVAGQLFVGFEPNQLKQAVERARKAVK